MSPLNATLLNPFYANDDDYKLLMIIEAIRRQDDSRLERMIAQLKHDQINPMSLLGSVSLENQLVQVSANLGSVRAFKLVLNTFDKALYTDEKCPRLLERFIAMDMDMKKRESQEEILQKTRLLLDSAGSKKEIQALNEGEHRGLTFWYLFLTQGSVAMLSLLLEKGLSVTFKAHKDQYDFLDMLEEAAAECDEIDSQEAIYQKTKLFIQKGLSPSALSKRDPTKLRWQKMMESIDFPLVGVLRAYVEAGMDLNWQDPNHGSNNGFLYRAITHNRYGNLDMTKHLLSLGASLKAVSAEGISVWAEVLKVAHDLSEEMMDLLIEQDVDWDTVVTQNGPEPCKQMSPLACLIAVINNEQLMHILTKTTPESLFKKNKNGVVIEPLMFTKQACDLLQDSTNNQDETVHMIGLLRSSMEEILLKQSLSAHVSDKKASALRV